MEPRKPSRSTAAASGIRRNLFSSNLSRRPPASSASGTSVTTLYHPTEQSNNDLVARDEQGNYRLDMPVMAPMGRNELQEEHDMENRLIETYRTHQEYVEPSEVKASLQTSLNAKVQSLDDDKWMFESEEMDTS